MNLRPYILEDDLVDYVIVCIEVCNSGPSQEAENVNVVVLGCQLKILSISRVSSYSERILGTERGGTVDA